MNKSELITATAQSAGITRKDAERAVNAALEVIASGLEKGEKIQLSGFGTFEAKDRKERAGRNPHSAEPIIIAATRVPSFKASKVLKDRVAK